MKRTIKTILISLNNQTFLENTMAAATQISRRYDCHIIGLYVIPSHIVYSAPYGYGGPIVSAGSKRFYASQSSKIEQDFRDYVEQEGLNGEWRKISSGGHYISETVIEHGRESDLIILGHDNSVESVGPAGLQFHSTIIQESGRPVLVVPNTHPADFSFEKAIVGWDGSREAARATFDAAPLLRISKRSLVTCFNPHKESGLTNKTPGETLVQSLKRHGITAELQFETTRKRISRALIDHAKNADLLVIGAYGHSRLRENILGGVTRLALAELPCPVLLST